MNSKATKHVRKAKLKQPDKKFIVLD